MKKRKQILAVVPACFLGLNVILEDHQWIACDQIRVRSKVTLWRESKP
jgi:hypothetical protein